MIRIYGKEDCHNCIEIKKMAEEKNDLEFFYTKDEAEMTEVAKNLMNKGMLVEKIAPLIIKEDGTQMTHEEFKIL